FVKKRPLPPEIQSRFDAVPEPIRSGLAHGLQQGLPAFSLSAQEALLTAIINDSGIGKELMYAQQVCVFGRKGDVFLGISTSGNAKNVQYAAITARAFGLGVIALTGETGGELAKIADVAICVPARETYKIQEYHLPVYHAICLALEERFFSC
ncbi:MAG: SIS domain-containing protein, partial [Spirochaetaceae bacterium]|nr:SIS domain-containing protein [Spirochaetaceae bacterium]